MKEPIQYKKVTVEYVIDENTTADDLRKIAEFFDSADVEISNYIDGCVITAEFEKQLLTDDEYAQLKKDYLEYKKAEIEVLLSTLKENK